jgi:hypothetical protein
MLRKSSLQDYWSLRPIIHTPYVASVAMSRDRFLALLTIFHLNNNDAKAARGQPGYDPLFKIFNEKVAEGLLASAGAEIQVQGQISSPAVRLVGRDHFLYRISATHAKVEGTSQRSCRVCAERSKCQTGKTVKKCTTVYCRK